MPCKLCEIKSVIALTNNKIKLCKNCFIKYFEKKVLKTIKKYNLIESKDSIGIYLSDKSKDLTLFCILTKLVRNNLIPITIKEETNIAYIKKLCKQNNLKLNIFSLKKEFKVKKIKNKDFSILKRRLLNKTSKKLKAKKLVMSNCLDDEVESHLMNIFKSNIRRSAILGPKTGIVKDKRFIPRIKPFYFLTEKEINLYAKIKEIPFKKIKEKDSFRKEVSSIINNLETRYPGTKNAILNSFLSILPLLKEHFKNKIKTCKICNEPSSSEICNACKILKK